VFFHDAPFVFVKCKQIFEQDCLKRKFDRKIEDKKKSSIHTKAAIRLRRTPPVCMRPRTGRHSQITFGSVFITDAEHPWSAAACCKLRFERQRNHMAAALDSRNSMYQSCLEAIPPAHSFTAKNFSKHRLKN